MTVNESNAVHGVASVPPLNQTYLYIEGNFVAIVKELSDDSNNEYIEKDIFIIEIISPNIVSKMFPQVGESDMIFGRWEGNFDDTIMGNASGRRFMLKPIDDFN